ncbi:21S rRNA (uridine(2791)-2'-O)-methyltransferase MRM2 [Penicillium brasilianum]|uniref:rRNA methyltransferase 2, mitochondrial n=1 Tax=Penicillium brasilianum TaxID=104259 RepID=A0A1S9RMK0_PENBI|nr:21S rRNA (uridine(2791)-2'-O)-methyltransferase MRM2 [Penicillium brasilianum]
MFALFSIRPRAIGSSGLFNQIRKASSKRWQARQQKDQFTREAAVQGLKSRAAFKLLQMKSTGYSGVDKPLLIWYALEVRNTGQGNRPKLTCQPRPGLRTRIMVTAVSRTQPNGRVLGVDIIPAQPPKGVSTIQGNFLAPEIQDYIQEFLRNPNRGRARQPGAIDDASSSLLEPAVVAEADATQPDSAKMERTVDVVLSDMSAPWYQTSGFWKRSLSNPYHRMMNTSGNNFRDHAGSMANVELIFFYFGLQDLCNAALQFSSKVLKAGGHFVCKFYQGAEDKELEKQLKDMFQRVHRLKPESSRSESKEAFFVGLDRKA